jgi:WD40 repeat protein
MKLSCRMTLFCLVMTGASAIASEPPITALAFTPDGDSVIAASQAGLVVYSWPDLTRQRTINCSTSNLHCLAFFPAAALLAVGGGNPSEDGSVELFSWPAGKHVSTLIEHTDSVRAVAWLSKTRLASAGFDRSIKIQETDLVRSSQPSPQQQRESLRTLNGHSQSVSALCLLNGERILVSADDDQSLRVWDLEKGEVIRSLNQHTKAVHDLALRPSDGGLPMIASAAGDRTIRFWQPTIGRMVRYVRLKSEPLSIAWLDSDHIVAACVDGHIRVVDANDVAVTATQAAIDGWAYAIAVNAVDGTVAVAGSDGQIQRVELHPAVIGPRKPDAQ